MTAVFADTSALYAVLDADDVNHWAAAAQWRRLLQGQVALTTTSYVLVETAALVQHRLGLEALGVLDRDVVPVLQVEWVGETLHTAAMSSVLAARRRGLSLVDCVSFAAMRALGLSAAFAFDAHFAHQGFPSLPIMDETLACQSLLSRAERSETGEREERGTGVGGAVGEAGA